MRLQREDYYQKVTTDLARRFQTLVFEKLKISNMVKSHLAYQIYNASWYKLRQLADYKSEVVLIEPSYTTQRCSRCDKIPEQKIGLDVRIYNCDGCGFIIDRDHNAARNIKLSSERALVEKLPLPVRQVSIRTWFVSHFYCCSLGKYMNQFLLYIVLPFMLV